MRIPRQLIYAVTLTLTGIAVGRWGLPSAAESDRTAGVQSQSAGPTILQIQPLSRLTILHVEVADALVTNLNGRLGGVSVVMVVRGDVSFFTDLGVARFEKIDAEERSAVLILAPPRSSSAHLDHTRTKLFAINEHGLWLLSPEAGVYARVINQAYADAERAVVEASDDPDIRAHAKQQAEAVLRGYFKALGWSVELRWQERLAPGNSG